MNTNAFVAPGSTLTSRSFFTPQKSLSTDSRRPSRVHSITMRSATNLERKAAKVEVVKKHLNESTMVFASSLEGLSVPQYENLKKELPEGTKVMAVKNTLMRRAIQESEWEPLCDFATQSNMWVFVGEEVKPTLEKYAEFTKSLKRDAIKGAMFEGTLYDAKGVEMIATLPSKKELITKIAIALKMVPTKVARSIHAVPTKLARAVKLAVATEEDSSAE